MTNLIDREMAESRFQFVAYLATGIFSMVLGVLYRAFEMWFLLVKIPAERASDAKNVTENLKIQNYNLPLEYILIGFGIMLIGYKIFREIRGKK